MIADSYFCVSDAADKRYSLNDMGKFGELDALLSSDEEEYYYHDSFMYAEELIETLSEEDVPYLLKTWKTRDESWCNRFSEACVNIRQPVLTKLIELAITTDEKISPTLGLLIRLPNQAAQSDFYEHLLNYCLRLWSGNPDLRRQIQMCAWSCGLSGRMLKRLDFKSWKEAGL
jgi:hypothetical protein